MSFKIFVLLFACAASTSHGSSPYLPQQPRDTQYPPQLAQFDFLQLQQQIQNGLTQQKQYDPQYESPANTGHQLRPASGASAQRAQYEAEYENAATTRSGGTGHVVRPASGASAARAQYEAEYENAANTRSAGTGYLLKPASGASAQRAQYEAEYENAATTRSGGTGFQPWPGNGASTQQPQHENAANIRPANRQTDPPNSVVSISNPHERFSSKLLGVVGPSNAHKNVIFSPIAVQMLLAFIYMGAHRDTARQLRIGALLSKDKNDVRDQYKSVLDSPVGSEFVQLTIANKMYYSDVLTLADKIDNFARTFFNSEVEKARFSEPALAAMRINSWVADKTQNRIQGIVSADTIEPSDSAILINAIYLKAKWDKEFSTANTRKQDFHLSSQQKVPANMMFNEDSFRYAKFPTLQAQIIELKYRGSELSMLVILPDRIDGLAEIEQRLENADLSELASKLRMETVELRLPQFRVEFDIDMVQPLKALGIEELFSRHANLSSFFPGQKPVGVSKVQHRAFIDVNEAGSEAAAVSFAKLIPLSLPPRIIQFTADHPFIFAIRSPQVVYFVGHVANIRT